MKKNEIKKILYKKKPLAVFEQATKSGLLYKTHVVYADIGTLDIQYLIPLSDIGDAAFSYAMKAHLLIRYLIIPERTNEK